MSFFNIEGVSGFVGSNERISQKGAAYNLQLTAPSAHTSNHFLNIHIMKAEMPIDILHMFRSSEIPPIRAMPKSKARKPEPILARLDHSKLFEDRDQAELVFSGTERRQREAMEREVRHRQDLEQKLKDWMPFKEEINSDPFKTLFVGRLP
jgi:hypothetical protein